MTTSMSANTPPELSFSVPTSECYSDGFSRPTRSHSVDSGFSLDYDYENDTNQFSKIPEMLGESTNVHYIQTFNPSYQQNYQYDVLTENQSYINTMPPPPRKDSTAPYCGDLRDRRDSTYASVVLPSMPIEIYPEVDLHHDVHPSQYMLASQAQPAIDDTLEYNYVDFSAFGQTAPIPLMPDQDRDQLLLNHFVTNVLQLMLPVLEVNIPCAQQNFVLPALQNNRAFLHSCLAVSAMHLKATRDIEGNDVDEDILRHRKSTIEELCESMNTNSDQMQLLEAILGIILFRSSVGSADDTLPDIAWHQHFGPAMKLIHQMELQSSLVPLTNESPACSFNLSIAAWIDILGSTMRGCIPAMANTYRDKFINSETSGLSQLMGCDDQVMYLISEIACLETHKNAGLSDEVLLEQVTQLARQIDYTETPSDPVLAASQAAQIDTGLLSDLMTAAFRCAARIYLTSLVPGCKDGVPAPFNHHDGHIKSLLNKLTSILEQIPTGIDGFDRSLVWVYLIGGSVATPDSSFRSLLTSRADLLMDEARFGSFGSMFNLITNVWQRQDESESYVHWRDIMNEFGWDFLLI